MTIVIGIAVIGVLLLVIGILYLMNTTEPDNLDSDKRVNALQDKYSTNMNRFAARKEAKPAAARAELLTALNNEASHLVQTINTQAAAEMAELNRQNVPIMAAMQHSKALADHDAYIALSENTRRLAEMASQLGVDPGTMRELVLEKARMETQLAVKQREVELELEKARQLKQIDFDHERQMAQLDAQMAEMKLLLPYYELNVLNTQLAGLHKQLEMAEQLPDGEYKVREMKRIEDQMKAWSKDIRVRQKRLSQGSNGSNS
jgi:hypothetical protein